MKKLIFILTILALVSVPPVWAQSGACSTQTIRGYYALTCTGDQGSTMNCNLRLIGR